MMSEPQKSQFIAHKRTPRPPIQFMLRSFIGAMMGIGILALLAHYGLNDQDLTFVIGAFGASAVLIYGAPNSPLAQPYNVVFGHFTSACVGVSVFQLVGDTPILAAPLAVALAIVVMQATRSLHPPGGASALIAVVASPDIHDLGFAYVVYPVATGALVLVGVGVIVNSAGSPYRWPNRWW